ncbi:hypothetical protein Ga0080559_TMP2906 [Salipiger profundus]|uniref:Uncharacterized protein n=1 Tax=Salipiger profundus TaxID=1229727 RepID=A0A1U7D6G7_9RHOB|nr:hypothetical protein Ga0080559_TMP2906 [Salipiger profundus]
MLGFRVAPALRWIKASRAAPAQHWLDSRPAARDASRPSREGSALPRLVCAFFSSAH